MHPGTAELTAWLARMLQLWDGAAPPCPKQAKPEAFGVLSKGHIVKYPKQSTRRGEKTPVNLANFCRAVQPPAFTSENGGFSIFKASLGPTQLLPLLQWLKMSPGDRILKVDI